MLHHHPTPLTAGTPIDARVYALVEDLIATPLDELHAPALFGQRLQAQGISFARVLRADVGSVVIEFTPDEVSRSTTNVYRLECEFSNQRARLLQPWQTQSQAWALRGRGAGGLQNAAGKRNAERQLGRCLMALQGAKTLHGKLQEHTKDA